MDSVTRIVIANVKGGCGKTTVATNLVSSYSAKGIKAALLDYDAQGSSMQWLRTRPDNYPNIHGIAAYQTRPSNVTRAWAMRLPEGTERVVMDTPAGLKGGALIEQVRAADIVIVPVLPSPIDMFSTAEFIKELLLVAKVRSHNTRVALVANRVKKHTRALFALNRFLHTVKLPLIAHVRDTQNYVLAAENGIGIVDLPGRRIEEDRLIWGDIVNWIERGLHQHQPHSVYPMQKAQHA